MTLYVTDRCILDYLRDGFPITSRPYRMVAEELGIHETDLLKRLTAMKESRVISRFGPFFNAAAMGGASCLCAMSVSQDEFNKVMTMVNAHPEVAHNYECTHRLNIWFVLITETQDAIAHVAAAIELETGVTVLCFPKQKEFSNGFRVAACHLTPQIARS